MKTYIKIAILTGAIFAFTSCEDFLDNKPLSDFTSDPSTSSGMESRYKSVTDAQAELQGAYEKFKADIFQFENFDYNDAQSDNCYIGGDGVAEAEVDALRVSSMNDKVSMMWAQYYEMSGAATNVIENTRLMKKGIDEATRKQIMAEAKFIRAFAYFDIVRIWGDAPLLIDLIPAITSDNLDELYPKLYPARTAASAIYTQIESDLTQAIPYLSSMSKGAFKATKGAAYGLMAKVLATKGEKSKRDYAKVVKYCDSVALQGYTLTTTYEELWTPANKNTTESIFEVSYSSTAPNWAYWVLYSEEDGTITWRRYCTPTHELMNTYEQGDQRKASSFVFKEVPYDIHYPASSYPIANKIRQKDQDIILMRYADIMLLKAEALVEVNNVSGAITIVNQIRHRAGLDAKSLSMSQSDARLVVENERRLELVMEGQRWFDLLRNDRMVAVMSHHTGRNGELLFPNVEPFRSLWPIPQTEKDSNVNLTQNAGY